MGREDLPKHAGCVEYSANIRLGPAPAEDMVKKRALT